jgi:hypothetical protein
MVLQSWEVEARCTFLITWKGVGNVVPQGRLTLAQDAVLGYRAKLISPVGTTEKVYRESLANRIRFSIVLMNEGHGFSRATLRSDR